MQKNDLGKILKTMSYFLVYTIFDTESVTSQCKTAGYIALLIRKDLLGTIFTNCFSGSAMTGRRFMLELIFGEREDNDTYQTSIKPVHFHRN